MCLGNQIAKKFQNQPDLFCTDKTIDKPTNINELHNYYQDAKVDCNDPALYLI